jgi:hypothetical protein
MAFAGSMIDAEPLKRVVDHRKILIEPLEFGDHSALS